MRKIIPREFICALILGTVLATSWACLAPYDVAGGVSVSLGPPPLRVEARVAAPGPGYVWVDGYWDWGSGDWTWVPGAWVRSPHERARWVRPNYHRRHGHWYYTRGHWR